MTASSKPVLHPDVSQTIQMVELDNIDTSRYSRRCVGCVVLSQNDRIILQERDPNCYTFPGCLATFGGGIEKGETPMDALVRELDEELGARVKPAEVISLGAITEEVTGYNELVYVYFWKDKNNTIKGCYEGKARYYGSTDAAFEHPKIMDDVIWHLNICKSRKLLKN